MIPLSDDDIYSECLGCHRRALTAVQFERITRDARYTPEVQRWATPALRGSTHASHGSCPWCAPRLYADMMGCSLGEAAHRVGLPAMTAQEADDLYYTLSKP